MPCLRAGMAVAKGGYMWASQAKSTHQEDTKANWIRVRVIGLGKALRMDFEEVFVRAELMYQTRQSIYSSTSDTVKDDMDWGGSSYY